ncbi:MAG: hypothetical protein ACW967_02020 [Candidatus Hodarchaeales archaeon]|jgi:hypothetical protein
MSNNATSSNRPPFASAYRVKFRKKEFLHLVKLAKPEYLFHVNRVIFFAFQGFTVYSLECAPNDFNELNIQILNATEFTNRSWKETAHYYK